jgi:hypothetical protein
VLIRTRYVPRLSLQILFLIYQGLSYL